MPEGTNYCPGCGSAVSATGNGRQDPGYVYYKKEETGAIAWGILSFILTWITLIGGIILCLVLYGSDRPKGGFAALMGMIAAIVVGIIAVVLLVIVMAASSSQSFIG